MFSAVVKFQTPPGAPGPVQNVEYMTNSNGSVSFKWDAPFALGSLGITYVFMYGGNLHKTTKRSFNIPYGREDKLYMVKIYSEVSIDGKVYQGPTIAIRSVLVKGGTSSTNVLNIAVAVTVGIIALVAIIVAVVFWRKRKRPDMQNIRLDYRAGNLYSSYNLYVDPTTYDDVIDAVQEFASELDRTDLKIGEQLGRGEFGEVFKGEFVKISNRRVVAIKMLKAGASNKDRDDFLSEAAILGQFADDNVVSLEGVILKDEPNIIVLEFMCNGALDKYLQKNDGKFTTLELLGMARDVSSGMKYLSEIGFIHRDLAARNILVNEMKVCKVSDFGMSREVNVDQIYESQGGKIPIKWTAPEAIKYKKFTTSSDVWSYGILLWEILSFGEKPYWTWRNYEVINKVNAGYRLPPPMGCPEVVHTLMLSCWDIDRVKRPNFAAINGELELCINKPELLHNCKNVNGNYEDVTYENI